MIRLALSLPLALLLVDAPRAQVFVRNTAAVPDTTGATTRYTENVDFGDVDLDGDFDAALARGGDFGNLQDRLWLNAGGLQGGTTGEFVDVTATALPAIARDGRDVEFADLDSDGDLDLYLANTSSLSNQPSLWWINEGGVQGGVTGTYTDQTAVRWVGLGGAGSSVSPALVLPGGGFVDWSCDADFGDLDNDGDLDLVHSSYGGAFTGTVPTRIFLNDGAGFFSEFNPSGFQLAGANIEEGDPGLWCQGTHEPDTLDATGTKCDVSTAALDLDLGDVDGDFDLDLLLGDRDQEPRFFRNGLAESSSLAFRDVTTAVFPAGHAIGGGNYEQELGDLDGDDDLDVFGLNWQASGFQFEEATLENDGSGTFSNLTTLAGSGADDMEGDFGDYDADGDLDVVVAAFSGSDRLYENTDGLGALGYVAQEDSGLDAHGLGNQTSLDADWCDVDADGDYDYWSAQDFNNPVLYWQNQTDVPDTTAPRVSPVEQIAGAAATITTSPDRVVRAHVYDNAPYYVTWYNPTSLSIYLDGELVTTRTAAASGGQVFRAEIPSNLVGTVAYEFVSEDRYSNSATSAQRSYVASDGGRTVDVDYGAAENGPDFAGELLLGGGSLLTPGKPWFLRVDVNTGLPSAVYLLAISLAPSAATPDPLLGMLNVDATQVVLGLLGTVGPTGVDWIELEVDPTATGISSVFAQAFRPNPSGGWSASRGLEIPFHE